jgi:hypothetical protein
MKPCFVILFVFMMAAVHGMPGPNDDCISGFEIGHSFTITGCVILKMANVTWALAILAGKHNASV